MRWTYALSTVLAITYVACQPLCAQAGCPASLARSDGPSITIVDMAFSGDPKIDAGSLAEIAAELRQRTYAGSVDDATSELEERARAAWQDRGYF